MKVADILMVAGLGLIAYSFLNNNENQQPVVFGAGDSYSIPNQTGVSSTGKPIEPVTYNITLEAPKIPIDKAVHKKEERVLKTQEQPNIVKRVQPSNIKGTVETNRAKYFYSQKYDKNIYEVAGVEDKKAEVSRVYQDVRPIIDVSKNQILGVHDYIHQESRVFDSPWLI